MYFDFFLISVILVTVYLGPFVVRRSRAGDRTYGWLLIADGCGAGLALLLRHTGVRETGDLLGFVAMAAGVCLVVVPPILRNLARRAVLADRPGVAEKLMGLRELLQPGLEARRERELMGAVMAVRLGQVDDAVTVLSETREALSDSTAQRAIDERIVITYLSARRWQEAIDSYELRFTGAPLIGGQPIALASSSDSSPEPSEEPEKAPQVPHLPLAPQLVVEMVRAYCEVGDLLAAARLLAVLEAAPFAEEPLLSFFRGRARMVFLAFVGRTEAVEHIVGRSGQLAMLPAATRHYWSGIARLNSGDRHGARAALKKAARLARRDRQAREIVDGLIASIDAAMAAGDQKPSSAPSGDESAGSDSHLLAPEVSELADRLASVAARDKASPLPLGGHIAQVTWRHVPVISALAVGNLLVSLAVFAIFGSTTDPGALVRAGGNLQSAVLAGEWWRLSSSMFLHGGVVHLLVNLYALWVLGKWVEQMYGSARCLAIYAISGLIGAIASAVAGLGMSVGASGAVLGLLGALIAELGLHRDMYLGRWRKHVFRLLCFVALAQVAIGFFYPAIDQAAHVGGLCAGGLAGALLSPRSATGRTSAGRILAVFLALASLLAIAYGAIGAIATDYGDTLARYGSKDHSLKSGLWFNGPAHWRFDDSDTLANPGVVVFDVRTRRGKLPDDLAGEMAAIAEKLSEGASRRAAKQPFAVPSPWQSLQYDLVVEGMVGEQRSRLVVFARAADGDQLELWFGFANVPAALAGDFAPTLYRVLKSMRRL